MMTSAEVMKMIVKTLDSKKALDIKVLRTDKITILADYFVICTGTSSTHVKTLSEETDKVLSENGEAPLRTEGYRGGGWVLVDFGCVILHIFTDETRKFYGLERLWGDATPVDVSSMITE
jgi:iojap-like ribosome-associated protein